MHHICDMSETGIKELNANTLPKENGVKGGSTPGALTNAPEVSAQRKVEEFRKFLEKLNTDVRYDALTVFTEALKFVEGIGLNALALSENLPLFYSVGIDSIMFVWPSGMTFEICLRYYGPPEKREWKIHHYFDHLARTEVYE